MHDTTQPTLRGSACCNIAAKSGTECSSLEGTTSWWGGGSWRAAFPCIGSEKFYRHCTSFHGVIMGSRVLPSMAICQFSHNDYSCATSLTKTCAAACTGRWPLIALTPIPETSPFIYEKFCGTEAESELLRLRESRTNAS